MFNDKYDYFFGGTWVGQFDGQNQVNKSVYEINQTCIAVPPETADRSVPLWKPTASITAPPTAGGSFVIDLKLLAQPAWTAQ